ncbi:MAG: glycosyltransferase family 9 protein [Verrucomicrobiia bacterium]
MRVIGLEHLYEAVKQSGGAVMATGHFSCWELLAHIPQFAADLKFNTLYQPLKNRRMDEWMRQIRAQCGVGLISRRGAWKTACEKLRHGEVVAIFADQHAGNHGIWTPFFGKLASTSPLSALIAKRTRTWIVPATIRTTKTGWEVEFSSPLKPHKQTVAELTFQLNQQWENAIRQHPHDWFWGHERWKIPNPRFLLKQAKREIYLPQSVSVKPFRVLVRGMNWLGDAVMHLGALRNLKEGRPDLHLTVLTPKNLTDLYCACAFVDAVQPLPQVSGFLKTLRQVWLTAQQLREQSFDVAILLPNSYRTILEVWLGGIKRRVGFRVQGRGKRAINHKIPMNYFDSPNEHQAFRWLNAVKWLGGEFKTEPYLLEATTRINRESLGVIAPGAAFGPAKRWLPERFAHATRGLSEVCEKWVIVGAPEDQKSCREVAALLPGVENLCGKTHLGELILLLLKSHFVLCNDSGVMHLAGICGAKVVAIFGSTEPQATRARQSSVAYVRHHLPCSPCFRRECPLGHYNCLKKVTIADVLAVSHQLLEDQEAKPLPSLAWVGEKS